MKFQLLMERNEAEDDKEEEDSGNNSRIKWRKIFSLLGAFLIFIPNGVAMYWGNLAVYVGSYIVIVTKSDPIENQAPWLISIYIICRNIGVICCQQVMRCLSRRVTMLLAMLMFNIGLIMCYWGINVSAVTFDLSLGVLTGYGNGLLHAVVMLYVIDWSGSNIGAVTSAVMTGYTVGSALFNEGITTYVNPSNEEVNITISSMSYFSQPEILNRVPMVFLLLASVSMSFHIFGCALVSNHQNVVHPIYHGSQRDCLNGDSDVEGYEIRNHQNKLTSNHLMCENDSRYYLDSDITEQCSPLLNDESCNESVESFNSDIIDNCIYHTDNVLFESEINNCNGLNSHKDYSYTYGSESMDEERFENAIPMCIKESPLPLAENQYSDQNNGDSCVRGLSDDENSNDGLVDHSYLIKTTPEMHINGTKQSTELIDKYKYKYLSLFFTRQFYVLLSMVTANDLASLILTTYYKRFGQNWIDDDHFLTNLGTVLSLSSATRLLWGWTIDRYGLKPPALASIISLCIVSSTYYFTPAVDKWLFFTSTLLFGCSNSAVFTSFHVGIIKLLGKDNFTTNYGILTSSTMALNLIAPPIIKVVLSNYGWFPLFLGCGVTAFWSLIIVLMFMP